MADDIHVFYSWQSDLQDKLNRTFIEEALNEAIDNISKSTDPPLKIVLDQDARGKAGSPDLASELFDKIKNADVFVADVSVVGVIGSQMKRRHMPNPNVMNEHGFALHAHGQDRILAICNIWKATPEKLPFDIRHRRVIEYRVTPKTKDLSTPKKELARKIEIDLRQILAKRVAKTSREDSISIHKGMLMSAIESNNPGFGKFVKLLWKEYFQALKQIDAERAEENSGDDSFIKAIEASAKRQHDLYEVFDKAAEYDHVQSGLLMVQELGAFVEYYYPRRDGQYGETDFDVFKFLGHEAITALISCFLTYRRWDSLERLLNEKILVKTRFRQGEMVGIENLAEWVRSFDVRKKRLGLSRISLHSDYLKERHSQGQILGDVLSASDFRSGDLLLHFWDFFRNAHGDDFVWRAFSTLHVEEEYPRFLLEATVKGKVVPLMELLGMSRVEELRTDLQKATNSLGQLWRNYHRNPVRGFDFSKLGTK